MNARHRRWACMFAIGTLTIGLAACDSTDDEGAGPPEAAAETDAGHGDDHEALPSGGPADPADADRAIEVEAHDDLTFSPAMVDVAAGETVTFVVTNTGVAVHEFTLGDAAAQHEHATEMGEAAGQMAHDEPNSVSLGAGETKELTWHFPAAGKVLYGCHEPGHYAGGMVGQITVT